MRRKLLRQFVPMAYTLYGSADTSGRHLMKTVLTWLVIFVTVPTVALAESCPKMAKDLARLRKEYHKFVTARNNKEKPITFEQVAEKLDEIVDLKHKMRKSACKIPPRSKPWEPKP